jgi:hypothetical protein
VPLLLLLLGQLRMLLLLPLPTTQFQFPRCPRVALALPSSRSHPWNLHLNANACLAFRVEENVAKKDETTRRRGVARRGAALSAHLRATAAGVVAAAGGRWRAEGRRRRVGVGRRLHQWLIAAAAHKHQPSAPPPIVTFLRPLLAIHDAFRFPSSPPFNAFSPSRATCGRPRQLTKRYGVCLEGIITVRFGGLLLSLTALLPATPNAIVERDIV